MHSYPTSAPPTCALSTPVTLSADRSARTAVSPASPVSPPAVPTGWLCCLSLLLSLLLVGGGAVGCTVEGGADGTAPNPNGLPSADENGPDFGADGPPRHADQTAELPHHQPGVTPVSTDAQSSAVPYHVLSIAASAPVIPPLADGSKPAPAAEPKDTPKDDGAQTPATPPAASDDKAAEPASAPEKASCKQASDCPVVANGCIVMACEIDASGAGTCQENAFVCQCLPGQDVSCDDKDPCTIDTCSDVGACSHTATQSCDDGNLCTQDTCINTAVAGQPNLATCQHKASLNIPCEDDDPCTGDSTCAAGGCTAGFYYGCDDGEACTFDVCVSGKGCVHTPTDACGA